MHFFAHGNSSDCLFNLQSSFIVRTIGTTEPAVKGCDAGPLGADRAVDAALLRKTVGLLEATPVVRGAGHCVKLYKCIAAHRRLASACEPLLGGERFVIIWLR